MKTIVSFTYYETSRKWEVTVSGVVSDIEAKQAFNAVVLTCLDATPELDANKATKVEGQPDTYKISIGL